MVVEIRLVSLQRLLTLFAGRPESSSQPAHLQYLAHCCQSVGVKTRDRFRCLLPARDDGMVS